jgi:hypothetical protein
MERLFRGASIPTKDKLQKPPGASVVISVSLMIVLGRLGLSTKT